MIQECENHKDVSKGFCQNATGWIYSHLEHHTVRDEETSAVSFLLKIQPNSECEEAGMTFGAVKAMKQLALEFMCLLSEPGCRHTDGNLHPLG